MKLLQTLALLAPLQSVDSFSTKLSLLAATSRISLVKRAEKTDERSSGIFSDEVQQEAKDALESVGWARPSDEAEMTSDDPFVQQIDAGIQNDFGVGLDDLLNPAKVTYLGFRQIP